MSPRQWYLPVPTARARAAATPLLATAALVLALAGCAAGESSGGEHGGHGDHTSSADGTSADGAQTFNDADVMFAQMMIPHHEQAVVMSEMVLDNPDTGDDVRILAQQILDAQGPEIETMTTWLTTWGAETGGDHSEHGGMEGMLTEDELAALENATGSEVDRLFLASMIAHHEGAVAMAEDEIAQGADPDAIALAETIVATQQNEIDTMTAMLDDVA